jgi:GntR family transcriptional regulator/MocR family aminotransferase
MKPGYHEIYSRYRDNITRGVLKPGDKCPPSACWRKS